MDKNVHWYIETRVQRTIKSLNRGQFVKDRIKVIIVNQVLGY
ncbi:hypothetical protein HAHI6034_10720 [Hathewaya histolytica]|uniref:Uncharacterized protein n=1 Tax=Hathewaya histolytica TaxID=1498 RepID=A0A4U9RFJ8_HATHI|nr:hypothetical protein [Hathewaya histolytica]VTQ89183.1 Uncharacterised protein [Hathewaya histolytica]